MTEFWNQRWFRDALPYAAGALAAAGAVGAYGASSGWFDSSSAGSGFGGVLSGGDGEEALTRLPRSISTAMGEPVRSVSSAPSYSGGIGSLGGTPDATLPLPPPSPPGEGFVSRIVNNGIPGLQTVTQMIANNPELAVTAALAGGSLLGGQSAGRQAPNQKTQDEDAQERSRRDLERWNSYRNKIINPSRGITRDEREQQGRVGSQERRYFSEGGALRQVDAIRGPGDGMSDDIPAVAVGQDGSEREIYVADGEYIIAADVVSGLGNGSSEAGIRLLDEFQRRVRERRATQGEQPEAMDAMGVLPA